MTAFPLPVPTEAETLRFAIGDCSLGRFLVAISEVGVAAILIGDNDEALRRELGQSLPGLRATGDGPALAATLAAVAALLEAPHSGHALALDLRGSALEELVWRRLRDVPAGETITYGRIARMLPIAATAQEVGAACAANRLAVAIPCHRVIKADGSISGYRWGVARKRKLLHREAAR